MPPSSRSVLAVLAGLSTLNCSPLVPAERDGGSELSGLVISVDTGESAGPVRDVFGVNKGPTQGLRGGGGTLDAAKLYKSFNVGQVRLHDVGVDPCSIYKDATVVDLSVSPSKVVTGCNFPDIAKRRSWTVNDASKVDDPASYDFTKVDALLAAVQRSGAKVYLRIGAQDYAGPNDTGDVATFARVSINIYRHVTGKFKPGPVALDPEYVEVGNEPDGAFWRGDRADFVAVYNQVVDGVRAAALKEGKSVKVGGAGFTDELLENVSKPGNVANGFVADVTPARLDFFSAHHYDECSAATLAGASTALRSLRASLAVQGIPDVPLQLSEWNIGLGVRCSESDFTSAQAQSFVSGMLTLMQDDRLNISAAHFYSGVPPMSLFTSGSTAADGMGIAPSAWALRAHGELQDGTRVKAEVCNGAEPCVSGIDSAGAPLVVLAGRLAAGGHRVIVTNDSDEARPFTLRVSGLSGSSVSASVRRPPSSPVQVAGTVSGGVFTPTDAQVAAAVASETREPVSLPVTGGVGTVELTVSPRALVVVELP